MVPSDRTGGNGHILKHNKSSLIIIKWFCCCEGGQALAQLAKSPSLEMLKTHLDVALGNLLLVTLIEHVVGLDGLQGTLPASAILWMGGEERTPLGNKTCPLVGEGGSLSHTQQVTRKVLEATVWCKGDAPVLGSVYSFARWRGC